MGRLYVFSLQFFIYLFTCSGVAKSVARIIALALDLDGDFFDKPEMLDEPIAILRLLHYEGVRQITGHIFLL